MNDLTGKLTDLLNDPEIMKQIKNLSGSFGDQDTKLKKPNSLGKGNDKESLSSISSGADGLSPDILNTISKLAPIISSFSQEDKYTNFLESLKPLLSEPRKRKLDESAKFLKLMQILPALKDKDII